MSAADLNLLRVFDALLEEQSVTRAGARLGLTQSAVSHALARLRQQFSDPLFVRGPAGMQPTPRALEIGPGVHTALIQLQNALLPSRFDPATDERRVVLAAGAYGCATLAPSLVARLTEQAPGVQLQVVQPEPDVLEQLDARRADFALWAAADAPERFTLTPLMSDDMVWAVRRDHPLPGGPVTLGDLAAIPQAAVAPRRPMTDVRAGVMSGPKWEGLRAFEEALAAAGLSQPVGVTVPDLYSAIAVVARSDMAALIPRRIGRLSAELGVLRLIEPPHPSPDIRISLMMLRERRTEPALVWMRDQLAEVARGL